MTKPITPILIRLVPACIVAHVIIARGRDVTLEFLINEEFYPRTICSSFVICLIIWGMIHRLTRHFDLKFDWMVKPLERLIIQVPCSVIIPICLMTTMVSLQFFLLHGDLILDAKTLVNQFLVSGYFVLLLNLGYLLRYLLQRLKETQKVLERDFPYHSNFEL